RRGETASVHIHRRSTRVGHIIAGSGIAPNGNRHTAGVASRSPGASDGMRENPVGKPTRCRDRARMRDSDLAHFAGARTIASTAVEDAPTVAPGTAGTGNRLGQNAPGGSAFRPHSAGIAHRDSAAVAPRPAMPGTRRDLAVDIAGTSPCPADGLGDETAGLI